MDRQRIFWIGFSLVGILRLFRSSLTRAAYTVYNAKESANAQLCLSMTSHNRKYSREYDERIL